jgi:predicted permease
MVHGLLTKGAPAVDAHELFTLSWTTQRGDVMAERSYDRYVRLAAETRLLSPLLASHYERVAVGMDDGTYAMRAGLVSQNYFDTLGVRLQRGRTPSPDESRAGAPDLVAVVSDRLWHEHFAGAEDIVGRRLIVNGQEAAIVGVAPRGFQGAWLTELYDVWLPFASSYPRIVHTPGEAADGRDAPVLMTGRLRSGVSRDRAQAELAAIAGQPGPDGHVPTDRVSLVPYSATAGGDSFLATMGGRFLAVFSIVTLLTLLIVGANVANLMLGRAVNRQREVAVRRALGCSHLRIVRMLIVEGIVVSTLAWVGAVAFAWTISSVLASLIPPPQGATAGFAAWYFRPDLTVAAYALALAGVATVACVLGPVLFASRQPLTPWLKAGDHSVVRGRSRLSRGLVILQLSLSVLLVAVAGLAWRSLSIVGGVDLGYRADRMLLVTVNTAGRAPDAATRIQLLEDVRVRLQKIPGATTASYADSVPRETSWPRLAIRTEVSAEGVRAETTRVGPGFVGAYGLDLLAGQDMGATNRGARRRVLINQRLAQALWPGQSPVGRHVSVGDGENRDAEIAGVAPNAFFSGFRSDTRPYYVLIAATDDPSTQPEASLYLHFTGDLDAVAASVRDALGPTELSVPIVAVRTMETQLAVITDVPRMLASMLAAFGLGALVIATLGQYSVVLFDMRRRIREFGVRLALGASPQRIRSSVIREGAWLSAIGLAIGGALSVVVGRLMGGVLYGVSAIDGLTYAMVAALLAVTTLVACAIPARMASRVDPLRVLREE